MTEEELFSRIDEIIDWAEVLIRNKDLAGLYELCQSDEFRWMKNEEENLAILYAVSGVVSKEDKYRKNTILDLVKPEIDRGYVDQLKDIFNEISLVLLRIENNLSEDFIVEGLQAIAEKDISGDMLISVASIKLKDSKRVLKLVAEVVKEINPITSFTILKYLVNDADIKRGEHC